MRLKLENIMNKDSHHASYKSYLLTILLTVILTFTVAFAVQLNLLFRCEKKINFEELNLENLSKFYTLDQLEKLIKKNPNNTAAYIKIANIYAQLNEPANANIYYKKALTVSKRSNFSLYSYAIFSADNGLLNNALALAEEISANSSKTFEFRAKIYEAIADNLTLNNHFDGANKAYQIAYKYAKNVDSKALKKRIQEKYAISYTKTADEKIEEHKVDDAIYDLKNSVKILSNPIAKYKLALIYKDIDPKTSERYLSQVLREDPYIINPYIYNTVLNNLYKNANLTNNSSDINYYSNQIKKFNKKLQTTYLYKKDVSITNPKIIAQKKAFSKENSYILSFDIKNNSDLIIKDLYFNVQLIGGSKIYETEKQLISKINPLIQYSNSVNLKFELNNGFKFNDLENNNIYIKFYCKKAKKAPWTLITIQNINI